MKEKNIKSKLFIGLSILTFCLVLFLVTFIRVDPDYFWHIKAGEYMFHNGLLKRDVFSWFLESKYWMSHEWLFDVIIYGLKVLFGRYHMVIYGLLTIGSLIFILFLTNKKNYLKNIPFTLIWYLVFFIMMLTFIQVRPHMISFSLLALTISFLYDLYKNEDSKKIYFLPLITIIWANVHGGSSNLPYLFCLIFLIGGLFSFKKKKIEAKRMTKKQLLKYFVVMILCMLCVCINLHGFKMFIYPYLNMLDATMLSNISEWRGTSLSEVYHYIYFIFLIIIVMIFLFSDKKIEFMDLILFGVVTYLGLKSIRFWFYTYIVMSYIIFFYIKERKIDKGTFESIMLLCVILVGMLIVNIKSAIDSKYQRFLNSEVIEIIKKENPKRLFNMYDYGGELIYNDIKVFIDGRADLYTAYNYKDYLNISVLKSDYVKLIDKYDFDYFLVDKEYPINTYLKYNDNYEVLYKNDKLIFYKKVNEKD